MPFVGEARPLSVPFDFKQGFDCPNLAALSIECCPKIGNEGLQDIGKLCPKIRSVSIKDCPLVRAHGVSSLLLSASPILSKVKLQGLNITYFSLVAIGHHGKFVTNLMINGLHNVSEKEFWVMGLQKMISLMITSCFVSDKGLLASAKSVGSLECLHLEECNRIKQFGISGVFSNGGLKSLSLVKCMGIKDTSLVAHWSSPCNYLKSLSVRNCPGFGIGSIAMVPKLCPQLQHLDLSGLYGIPDSDLLPLLESCEAGLVK